MQAEAPVRRLEFPRRRQRGRRRPSHSSEPVRVQEGAQLRLEALELGTHGINRGLVQSRMHVSRRGRGRPAPESQRKLLGRLLRYAVFPLVLDHSCSFLCFFVRLVVSLFRRQSPDVAALTRYGETKGSVAVSCCTSSPSAHRGRFMSAWISACVSARL